MVLNKMYASQSALGYRKGDIDIFVDTYDNTITITDDDIFIQSKSGILHKYLLPYDKSDDRYKDIINEAIADKKCYTITKNKTNYLTFYNRHDYTDMRDIIKPIMYYIDFRDNDLISDKDFICLGIYNDTSNYNRYLIHKFLQDTICNYDVISRIHIYDYPSLYRTAAQHNTDKYKKRTDVHSILSPVEHLVAVNNELRSLINYRNIPGYEYRCVHEINDNLHLLYMTEEALNDAMNVAFDNLFVSNDD